MQLRTIFFLFLLLWTALVHAQSPLPPALQKAWQKTQLPLEALSLEVRDVSGTVLLSRHADTPRNPASVMKLVTTWVGLSALGSDYVWRTSVLSDGRVDEQGRLEGHLYIQAAGDPFLQVQDLWALLRELRLRGVRYVNDVVVDRSRFGDVSIDPGRFDQSPDRPYNASPDAMMVGLGATRVLFSPDVRARKWVALIDPPVPGLRVRGQVQWREGRCAGNAHNTQATAQVQLSGETLEVVLGGTVAGACGEFSLYRLALPQPDYFAALFRTLWRDLGGDLGGNIRSGAVPPEAKPLAVHTSRNLADMIRLINKHSNNVMARHLLLTLAAESADANGQGATVPIAERAALEVLRAQHVDTRAWQIDNGAGLSRTGRVTAFGLAGMLQTAWRSALMPEFVSSLAISGVDGTVRKRLRDKPVRGAAHVKTGSLRDARAIAGYVLGASGKRYIVVSLVNHVQAAHAEPFHDVLIRWLAAQ